MNPNRLSIITQRINDIAPVHGCAVKDGVIIRIDFKDEATTEQRAAAWEAAQAFDFSEPTIEEQTATDGKQQILDMLGALDAKTATSDQMQEALAYLIRRSG